MSILLNNIGFTGTRGGMTDAQKDAFSRIICGGPAPTSFHHGDCVGADDEAANIVAQICKDGGEDRPPIVIVCHPPKDEEHRAFNDKYNVILEAKTHFARNRDIVDACDILIATPREMSRQDRGGTWYTIDYAKKKKKRTTIIFPDGSCTIEPSGGSREP